MTAEQIKTALDGASVVTAVSAVLAWLPPIAAALSIVWTCIRIYESRTFQGWLRRWRK